MVTLIIRFVRLLPVCMCIVLMHGCAALHPGASSAGDGAPPHDEATLISAYDPHALEVSAPSFDPGVPPPAVASPAPAPAAIPNPLLSAGVVDGPGSRSVASPAPATPAPAPAVAPAQAPAPVSSGPFTMRPAAAPAPRQAVAPPRAPAHAAAPAPRPAAPPARQASVAPVAPQAPRNALHTIFFPPDGVTLTQQNRALIRENTQWLMARPEAHVVIEGHTDSIGALELNMAVGARRAQAVADYMQSLGLPASRMTVVSYGPDRPIDPRSTRDARARNRRVQFLVVEQADQQAAN